MRLPDLRFEKEAWKRGFDFVAGIDDPAQNLLAPKYYVFASQECLYGARV